MFFNILSNHKEIFISLWFDKVKPSVILKGAKMTELKTFKIEQKFRSVKGLYNYLVENVNFIGEYCGIQIQKPLKPEMFCLTGHEKITERNILFFASKSEFPDNIGELIVLASVFDVEIIVFFMPNTDKTYLEPFNWLQSICNDDTQFIVGEVKF